MAGGVALVALDVLGQVVGAHEAALAHTAAELLLARVRPLVTRQLVRAAEPPPAAVPLALERLLACKGNRRVNWLLLEPGDVNPLPSGQ